MTPKKQSDKPSKKNVEKAKTKNIEVTSENSFQKKCEKEIYHVL